MAAGFADHLKNANQENLVLEVAFGTHLVSGDTSKSISDGTTVNVQQLIGETYGKGWRGLAKGLWFSGLRISEGKYKFYPGIMSPGNSDPVQGVGEIFTEDTPHSNTSWVRFEIPADVAPNFVDNINNPPVSGDGKGFRAIMDCQLGDIYDAAGNVALANQFLTNAADACAFICKVIARYPDSRINFASLAALRQALNASAMPNYANLPAGFGLTGKYYSGTNFQTFVLSRIDPVIEFSNSEGSPAFQMPVDNFSVRFAGKIKPRYSETYTFTVTADNGCRLWVGDLTTPIIDQWADDGLHAPGTYTAAINLTANQLYDIRMDWNEGFAAGGSVNTAEIRLSWSSLSEAIEVVPQDRLYPLNEPVKVECHAKFISPASIDEALKTVLATSNAFYQDTDGKLNFYSFDTLVPTFNFNALNIIAETFRVEPRYSQTELNDLPTRYQATGRDLDSQYLEDFNPAAYFDVGAGNTGSGAGHIRIKTVEVGNTRRYQASSLLRHAARLDAPGDIVTFEGMPVTFPVVANDLVTLTWAPKGWINKEFLVLSSIDNSIDAAADNRLFRLLEWFSD